MCLRYVNEPRPKALCDFVYALELPASSILELFGKMFFEFCQDSGYDKILQVLGATPRDFLQVRIVRVTSFARNTITVINRCFCRIWTLCTITWAHCIRAWEHRLSGAQKGPRTARSSCTTIPTVPGWSTLSSALSRL